MPSYRSLLLLAVLIATTGWFGLLAVSAHLKRAEVAKELANVERIINEHDRQSQRLAEEIERFQAPLWQSLMARTRLNWKLPDEKVVLVYKSEKNDTILKPPERLEPSQPSQWQKWLDWFLKNRRD